MIMIDIKAPESCLDCPFAYHYNGLRRCDLHETISDGFIDVDGCDTNRHARCPMIVGPVLPDLTPWAVLEDDCK